jgi:hypothetical protein
MTCDAGWSSLVARRAHNPKVAGSNPAPATKEKARKCGPFLLVSRLVLAAIVPISFQFVLELGVARKVGTIEHAPLTFPFSTFLEGKMIW